MDIQRARLIAKKVLDADARALGAELMLLDAHTIALEHGWVFFYQTREYIESGDPLRSVGGNAPILVHEDGSVDRLSTATPVHAQLDSLGLGTVPRK